MPAKSTLPLRGAAALLALVFAAGCGLSPGDYEVYRVNVGEQTVAAECYFPDDEPPQEIAEDENSYRDSQTWVLYVAADDRMVLDAEGLALSGDTSDEGYTFVADQIDVDYLGMNQQEARRAVQTTTTIAMQTDGDAVAGEVVVTQSYACDFLTATPTPGLCEETPTCTRTRPFSGVRLEDVRLDDGVDRPNDEIGSGTPAPDPPSGG
ncbi:MAG: hypothetical protein R3B72_20385 [Polyangiaceae bacterium]